ncbi:MAG: modulator protein [Alphaproteobacteria bacterium CG11_big_fil_rev_8_21_14_0_20_44_7]|nr:MAG: modulator protein [Alphaproteobacteria bacterium CG11_big_fil_rev_8_21_14_0_20_44_7]
MDIENFAAELLEKSKKKGADAADILIGNSDDISVSIRNGKLEEIERSENSGFGLRIFIGNQSAIISSSKFEDVEELTERAISMAKETPADEFSALAPNEFLATKFADLDLLDENEPSAEILIDTAKTAESIAAAHKGITNSEGASASFATYSTLLATSNGFLRTNRSSYCGSSVSVIAGKDQEMQTDYGYSAARHFADLISPEKIGNEAATRALQKMNPRKANTGKYPIIFEPRIAKGLIGDLAAGINGASIARGTSFLKNKMDEQIFPAGVNIIDNPHMPRGLASKPYDGEGVANQQRLIIENGVLKTWLLDMRSANKLGLKTTGHASRSAGAPPSPSGTNMYMEAGNISPQELIRNIKSGFFVTDTFGMGINYTTGDYSQGASGLWIENGEIAYPVSEVTLAGNLLDIFANITPANDLEFKYSTNSPTLLIEGITLAGT